MPRIIDVKLLWQKVFSKFNMTNFIQCIYIYTVIYDNNDNDNSISCPLRWRSYSSRSQDGTSRERPKGWLLLRILHGQHRLFICCFCFRDIPRYDIYIIYIYIYMQYICLCVYPYVYVQKSVWVFKKMLRYNDLTTCRHWNELTTSKVFSDLTHTNAATLEM